MKRWQAILILVAIFAALAVSVWFVWQGFSKEIEQMKTEQGGYKGNNDKEIENVRLY
jgi:hypothetical protein